MGFNGVDKQRVKKKRKNEQIFVAKTVLHKKISMLFLIFIFSESFFRVKSMVYVGIIGTEMVII